MRRITDRIDAGRRTVTDYDTLAFADVTAFRRELMLEVEGLRVRVKELDEAMLKIRKDYLELEYEHKELLRKHQALKESVASHHIDGLPANLENA